MKILQISALLVFLNLPALASSVDEQRISAARELAHAHSVGDQVLLGNSLVRLLSLACNGDPESAAILGRKYFSGTDEFQADPEKAELFLTYAAKSGARRAAVELVLHFLKLPASQDSLKSAGVWLRVARFTDGDSSPHVTLADNGLRIALANNPGIRLSDLEVATEAGLIIHRIRNGIGGKNQKYCPAD